MTAAQSDDTNVVELPVHRVPRSIEYFANLPENRVFFEVETVVGDDDSLASFSLPKYQFLNPRSPAAKKLVELTKLSDDDETIAQVVKDVIALIDKNVGKIVARLADDQIGYIEHMWVQGSTVTIPESSASSSSSKNTAGPSKPTSSTKASASATSAKRTSRSRTSSQ